MSGSSLDGLDIVLNTITVENDAYSFKIIQYETVSFPKPILESLKEVRNLSSKDLFAFDIELGIFIGNAVNVFISKYNISQKIDFISSHGHTVFHFPSLGFTTQIGNGAQINHITNIPVINNLRATDVAHGGQGTPIVPIGDLLLFPQYKYCLNLGGIMNISIKEHNSIFSYDIGVCNQIINHYSNTKGLEYDKDGMIASLGHLNKELFNELNQHEYFLLTYPKSLDNGFSTSCILPIIENYPISVEDKLHTFYHHIAFQVKKCLSDQEPILISGGGAKNTFLLNLFSQYDISYILPELDIIDYKEALVMSLMGVRFLESKYNVLKSVTGASKNTINGQLFNNQ